MIEITPTIAIDPREITESFIRSPGPGGQNVNKVATAVQLRFDLRGSKSLPEELRARAERLAGRRLTKDGVLVITAARFRSQERNRALVSPSTGKAYGPFRISCGGTCLTHGSPWILLPALHGTPMRL